MPLPRFAASAAKSVIDRDHAREILNTYYHPEIRHAGDPTHHPGREVRIKGRVHIVVDADVIIAVGRYEPAAPLAESPVIGDIRQRHRRRGRGGQGTLVPTTVDELIRRIEAAGGEVEESDRHYLVTIPEGARRVPVPKNPRDWRSIRNSVAQLRRLGLDVRRDAC